VDDEDRENEGDLLVASQFATPEMINFMAKEARGLVCITMTGEMLDRLNIPMMVPQQQNTSGYSSPFTISVEASQGVTTGISAADRSHTAQVLIDPNSTSADIAMPGHLFPLRAQPDGVLARPGHTEAGVDLTRLAGLTPSSVICEIMEEDGTMARLPSLRRFAAQHGLKIISIESLIQYRRQMDRPVPALMKMGNGTSHAPLVRLHSECLTGDVLGSVRCDCGDQLQHALQQIAQEGEGMLLYLRQEGRGIGLANKIKAYALQDQGMDTVEANLCLGFAPDQRNFSVAAAMLRDQGVSAVRLMSNNPRKMADLEENQIRVIERVPHQMQTRPENQEYLQTKLEKLDHQLRSELLVI